MNTIKYGAASVKRLLSIHGPFCHICGLIMDFRHPPNDRIKCTRDHLVPRSKGGGRGVDQSNIRLAHYYCNSKRGNGDITDDLRWMCKWWVMYYVGKDELDKAEKHFKGQTYKSLKKHIAADPKVPVDIKLCRTVEDLWEVWG